MPIRTVDHMRIRPRPDRKLEELKALAITQGCTDREIVALGRLADESRFPDGATLAVEDQEQRWFHVIVAGSAEVVVGGKRVATLRPGATVGEDALLAGTGATATVIARPGTRTLVFGPREFRASLAARC